MTSSFPPPAAPVAETTKKVRAHTAKARESLAGFRLPECCPTPYHDVVKAYDNVWRKQPLLCCTDVANNRVAEGDEGVHLEWRNCMLCGSTLMRRP